VLCSCAFCAATPLVVAADWGALKIEGSGWEYPCVAVDAGGAVHIVTTMRDQQGDGYTHWLRYRTWRDGVLSAPIDSDRIDPGIGGLSMDVRDDGTVFVAFNLSPTWGQWGSLCLATVSLAQGAWQWQEIVPGTFGYTTSLACDADGYVHISYREELYKGLRYWTDRPDLQSAVGYVDLGCNPGRYSTIRVDSSAYPHVAYSTWGCEFRYAWWDGSAWQIESPCGATSTFRNVGLVLDALDRPHISFHDASGNVTGYAYKDPNWCCDVVWNSETRYSNIELDCQGRPVVRAGHTGGLYLPSGQGCPYSAWDDAGFDTCATFGGLSHYLRFAHDTAYLGLWDNGGARLAMPKHLFAATKEMPLAVREVQPVTDCFVAAYECPAWSTTGAGRYLTLDGGGHLWVTDDGSSAIYEIGPDGQCVRSCAVYAPHNMGDIEYRKANDRMYLITRTGPSGTEQRLIEIDPATCNQIDRVIWGSEFEATRLGFGPGGNLYVVRWGLGADLVRIYDADAFDLICSVPPPPHGGLGTGVAFVGDAFYVSIVAAGGGQAWIDEYQLPCGPWRRTVAQFDGISGLERASDHSLWAAVYSGGVFQIAEVDILSGDMLRSLDFGGPGNPHDIELGRLGVQWCTVPGDVTNDGFVDLCDLTIVLSDWGCAAADCAGDADGDADTDLDDLTLLLMNFDRSCP